MHPTACLATLVAVFMSAFTNGLPLVSSSSAANMAARDLPVSATINVLPLDSPSPAVNLNTRRDDQSQAGNDATSVDGLGASGTAKDAAPRLVPRQKNLPAIGAPGWTCTYTGRYYWDGSDRTQPPPQPDAAWLTSKDPSLVAKYHSYISQRVNGPSHGWISDGCYPNHTKPPVGLEIHARRRRRDLEAERDVVAEDATNARDARDSLSRLVRPRRIGDGPVAF